MGDYAGANWDRLMHSYQTQHVNNDNIDSDTFSYFTKMKKLLEKKSVNFWHKCYLERYVEEQIVPFELRVQIFPLLGDLTPEFKLVWEKILMGCSSQIMQALIGEYNRLKETIDNELGVLLQTYPDISAGPKYKEKDNELKDFLDKLNQRLITAKDKKIPQGQVRFPYG